MHRRTTLPAERSDALCDRTLSLLKRLPDGDTLIGLADALDERIADTESALSRLTRLNLVAAHRKPYTATVYEVRP